jgi:hypothetical protein
VGVPVAGALLVVSVDLADKRVHIHHELIITRAGAGRPRTTQCSAGTAGSRTPAFATACSSSNKTLAASGRPFTMWVTSWCRPAVAGIDSFLPAAQKIGFKVT